MEQTSLATKTQAVDGDRVAAPVSKLGYYVAHTPDVDRLAHYYEDALGLAVTERTEDTVYLTTGADHHSVVVRKEKSPDGRAGLGFELSGSAAEAAARLKESGVDAELRHDPEPGISEAVVLTEPWSDTPITLFERQASSGVATALGIRPTKLGHVASYVPALEPAQAFYMTTLGFRWSDTVGDFFVFLRCNADHHAINLMQSQKHRGLFHVAYEMRDMLHMKDALDHLSACGYTLVWGPGRHGAGHNLFSYHRDPDGNHVELFSEIDVIADEETGFFEPRPWHESWPQGPKVWEVHPMSANKWGPISPEMMEH